MQFLKKDLEKKLDGKIFLIILENYRLLQKNRLQYEFYAMNCMLGG